MNAWRDGAAELEQTTGVGVDVTAYIKHDDATDTATWLSQHGWVVTALDSRDEMARLGRPIPPDLADVAPVSSFVSARLEG